MCSIAGVLTVQNYSTLQERSAYQRRNTLAAVLARAEERGRDSWGVATPTGEFKRVGAASNSLHEMTALPGMGWAIANLRAEPTTEVIKDKTDRDIQPFHSGNWYIAHNGVIANDKELVEQYGLSVDTTIDSAVIAALLDVRFADGMAYEHVAGFLYEELKGSYALAIANASRPRELLLMCNYKPLFLAHSQEEEVSEVWFASLPEYLFPGLDANELFEQHHHISEIPPFHAAILSPLGEGSEQSIGIELIDMRYEYGEVPEDRIPRTLVVCSGGLDSTVVATTAVAVGDDVTLLHFEYECRAQEAEVRSVRAIAERLGVPLVTIPTDIFKGVIGGSSLTTDLDKEIHKGDSGVEFAYEWVPARNLIMLSIATGYAEAKGFDYIMLGNNLEESGAYPDNEMMFIRKLNEVMPYAVNVDKRVQLKMPVGNLMKHEIVKLGMALEAPLELCWSCYEAGEQHCGECGPCRMRKVAFAMNGIDDVITYAVEDK